jgi:hypothetical protein
VSKTPVPAALRAQVAKDARGRCGYCRSAEAVTGIPLEVEHLKPEASGGQTVRSNLWLACSTCNQRKGKRTWVRVSGTKRRIRLFDPRRDRWADHFRWANGGEQIEGITEIGRATVAALKLNLPIRVGARQVWIEAGRHPPAD